MNLKVEKFGNASWYFCPSCHKRIVVEITGNMLGGEKSNHCPECGQQLDWQEDVIRKKSWWRKFRQAICWKFGGEKRVERCLFEVRTSHPNEVICSGCRHNMWEKWDK